MNMLEIFKETAKESPVELNILSVKDRNSKRKLCVESEGIKTSVELRNSCNPGEERDYCWYVLSTAMSSIYLIAGNYQKAKFWMNAAHDKSLVTA